MPANTPPVATDGLVIAVRLSPGERAILDRVEARLKLLEDRLTRLIEMRLESLRQAVEAEIVASEIEDDEEDDDDEDDDVNPYRGRN